MTNVLGCTMKKSQEIDQILLTNKSKNVDDESHSYLGYSNCPQENEEHRMLAMPSVNHNTGGRGGGPSAWLQAKRSLCKTNCTTYLLAFIIALLGVSIVCLEMYRVNEVYAMRKEIDALRQDVDKVQHRLLEEDIMSELKAFEDAVYAEEAATEDSDTDEDDDEEEDDEDSDEYNDYDVVHDKSPIRDDHHAKHRNTETSKNYVDLPVPVQLHGDHNKHKEEAEKRAKREIRLPEIAGSYGVANKTEGLRLYESLVSNSQEILSETTETPIKQYHRVSPLWSSKQHRKKYHHQHEGQGHPAGHPSGGHETRQRLKSTQAPSPMLSRPSRVMKTDKDPSRRVTQLPVPSLVAQPLPPPEELREKQQPSLLPSQMETKKNPEGEIIFRVYQEQRAVPESTVKSVDIPDILEQNRPGRRRKPRPSQKTSIEAIEERAPTTTRHRLLPAAHFNGDTSRYTPQHEHYDGNGRLRHPDGVFTDWTPSKWVSQLGMDQHFHYDDGAVIIQQTGLYLVYAQIHYLDEHDINGYRVYVNNDPMLQCTTMTHSRGLERVKKSNTCFTASALFLTENDRLSLSDIGGLRYSLFEPTKSFFGLIKLGNVNVK